MRNRVNLCTLTFNFNHMIACSDCLERMQCVVAVGNQTNGRTRSGKTQIVFGNSGT